MKIGLGIGLINKSTSGGSIPPAVVVAPVISGSTTLGSTLTSTTGTWTGIPIPTFTYQWRRGASPIGGATSSTYVTVVADSLANITCVVTATNSAGTANSTSNTLTMGNYTPVNTVAPVVSGTQAVGQTLTTTNGTWTNSPSFSYQWYRGVTPIGTNSSTYTLVQADAGNTTTIKCTVTGTNGAGTASVDSNTLTQIVTARTNSFLVASAISDTIIKSALNTFDIGLISNSLDTKMKALYPFVGGTASTHKFNFMNAADTNAAFRLAFAGTWTHSITGAKPNGTNAYADTFIIPSTNTTLNSLSLGYYSRNTDTSTSGQFIASYQGASQSMQFVANAGGPNTIVYDCYDTSGGRIIKNITNYKAFLQVSRTGSTSSTIYRNAVSAGSISTSGGTPTSISLYLAAVNAFSSASGFNSYECAFAYISDGLNATEITNLYNLTQTFQTTLGRQNP